MKKNVDKRDVPNEFFGLTKQQVLDVCKSTPFPGMNKWPADHPIWDCNVAGYMTPRAAWKDEKKDSRAQRIR